jgi:hypothetical protein
MRYLDATSVAEIAFNCGLVGPRQMPDLVQPIANSLLCCSAAIALQEIK